MKKSAQIVWFKRDLRTADHAPLIAAAQLGTPIIPLYVVEPQYWRQPTASRRHWHFIHDCLIDLDKELTSLGQPLIVKVGETLEVLKSLCTYYSIAAIHTFEETGNRWTYERDIAVRNFCTETILNFMSTRLMGLSVNFAVVMNGQKFAMHVCCKKFWLGLNVLLY